MKIDRTKLKKSSSEVPPDCKALIDKLKGCNSNELLEELSQIKTWNCGECELYHWIDVLNEFDHILEVSCEKVKENQWCLTCDGLHKAKLQLKRLLLNVLQFTALLIEHSFSQHFYNSVEHLTTLLSSSDMNVVLAVLNLLYVFSKRSNFITRLNAEKRKPLLSHLSYLAESWGGKENGFGLAECCQNLPITDYPSSASTLHFEYSAVNVDDKAHKMSFNTVITIHIDNVDKIIHKTPSEIMDELVKNYAVPDDKQLQLFTQIRLAHSFSDYPKRMLCVQARLQALSVLVCSNAVEDIENFLLCNGLIKELVDLLELQDSTLIEIKAAARRILTSIIPSDKNPKLSTIENTTGAESYHGVLPLLDRNCIQAPTELDSKGLKIMSKSPPWIPPSRSSQKSPKHKIHVKGTTDEDVVPVTKFEQRAFFLERMKEEKEDKSDISVSSNSSVGKINPYIYCQVIFIMSHFASLKSSYLSLHREIDFHSNKYSRIHELLSEIEFSLIYIYAKFLHSDYKIRVSENTLNEDQQLEYSNVCEKKLDIISRYLDLYDRVMRLFQVSLNKKLQDIDGEKSYQQLEVDVANENIHDTECEDLIETKKEIKEKAETHKFIKNQFDAKYEILIQELYDKNKEMYDIANDRDNLRVELTKTYNTVVDQKFTIEGTRIANQKIQKKMKKKIKILEDTILNIKKELEASQRRLIYSNDETKRN